MSSEPYVSIGEDASDMAPLRTTTRAPGEKGVWERVKKMVEGRKRRILGGCLLGLLVIWTILALSAYNDYKKGDKSEKIDHPGSATGRNGAVSSENELCSKIGVDALKDGGSAVDAAIATGICIGVTNMYSSGIGGGGFMVVRDHDGMSRYIDFREEAPALAQTDMYNHDPKLAQIGGLGVAVPGEIRGFEAAHKRYGKLEWKRLFQPSVDLAINGWEVNHILEHRINLAPTLLLNNPAFRDVFAPNGVLLKQGDIIKREKYGLALKEIGEKGANVFYEGWIAEEIVKTTKAEGGILSMDDMRQYQAKILPTYVGYYNGRRVITGPPPTSGPVLISLLNVMEGYDLHGEGPTNTNFHRLVEAYKHGFAQRSYYGDPVDPVYKNITVIAKDFSRKHYAWDVRHNITDVSGKTHGPKYYNPTFDIDSDHGTMHVSVLAADGSAVSMTCTVNLLFGGQIMNAATGIILNDEMDDFSIPGHPNAFGLEPSPYNFIHPRKRPLSSSVPVIIENRAGDHVEVVAGASGGSRIITATMQAVLDMLDWGSTPLQAVTRPRMHHQLLPNNIMVEWEFDETLKKDLEGRGHKFVVLDKGLYLSGVEVIRRRPDGLIEAASDWRKAGVSVGY